MYDAVLVNESRNVLGGKIQHCRMLLENTLKISRAKIEFLKLRFLK